MRWLVVVLGMLDIFCHVQAQDMPIEITYLAKSEKTTKNDIQEANSQQLAKTLTNLRGMTYHLKSNTSDMAICEPDAYLSIEEKFAAIPLKILYPVYYDLQKGTVYQTRKLNGTKYLVVYPFDEHQWILKNETQNILGHSCKKATTTYRYTSRNGEKIVWEVKAWYAEDIPLSIGPIGYVGLPEIILKLELSEFLSYTAKKITFMDEGSLIEIPKDYIKISRTDYKKL